jgi:perosamine synthetase
MFWRWRKGPTREKLRSTLELWFDARCSLFATGRDALLALLRSLPIDRGSEIIIQGFTCVALPNAIHAAGFTPVFAEVNLDTLNIDLDAIIGRITPRTKVIIVQHTFGIVVDMQRLREMTEQKGILLIEDCAHILPDVTGPKVIGKYSDFLMLSFGRDKAASGVSGGSIISKNTEVADLLQKEERDAKELSWITVKRLLLYPLIYGFCRPLYGIGIGKVLLVLASKSHMLAPVITKKEKAGYQPPSIQRMPSSLCALVYFEFKQFHSLNNHRRHLTEIYYAAAKEYNWNIPAGVDTHLPLQKFPLLVQNADEIRLKLKTKNIYLDDGWTGASICPRTVNQEAAGYIPGSCPKAERLSNQILTLPIHPTMTEKQAKKLITILQSELGSSATMADDGDS